MERLPFPGSRIRLLVANEPFDYANDFGIILAEFRRVLDPAGKIVIIDTPLYRSESDGERMRQERMQEFRRLYGMDPALARPSSYLTRDRLDESLRGLEYRMISVPPDFVAHTKSGDRGCLAGESPSVP